MKDYSKILDSKRAELAELKTARTKILTTGQSWRLRNGDDSREFTAASIAEINRQIAILEKEVSTLEQIVESNNRSPNGIRIRARAL